MDNNILQFRKAKKMEDGGGDFEHGEFMDLVRLDIQCLMLAKETIGVQGAEDVVKAAKLYRKFCLSSDNDEVAE